MSGDIVERLFAEMAADAAVIMAKNAEIKRLLLAGDALVQLICLNPNTPSQEDWDAAIAAWQETRRE